MRRLLVVRWDSKQGGSHSLGIVPAMMMAVRRRSLYQVMSAVALVTTVTTVLSACNATAANDDE
jgi:hypothetical protein